VSEKFSKKTDHGKWFGDEAKNHRQRKSHDPSESGHYDDEDHARANAGAFAK
jgi:hypothetical protein